MRTVIADLIDLVSPLATEVGDAAALDDLAAMVERGAGYTHQLSAHDRCGTVAGVVGELADELDRELGFVGTGSPMAAG